MIKILENKYFYLVVFLFLLSPFWVLHAQTIIKINLFLAEDSLVLLGISLLAAKLAQKYLPDSWLQALPGPLAVFKRRSLLFVLLISAILFAVLVAVNHYVLNSFLSSADEHSCYFLAECLRRGKLWVEPHPLSEFFNVVHVGNRAGKWFSVYPPGWPLLWAAGLQLGLVNLLNPFMAGLALVFFFAGGRILFGASAAFLGLLLAAFSPFFLFTSASYFSHTTCLLTVSIFFYTYLKWMNADQEKQRFFWAGIAAFAVGYGLMTRYLTMAAIAAPFLIYYYWPLLSRQRPWRKSDWIVPLIIAVFFLIILWQNYEITGKPFKAPNKFDKSWERLGFRADYTPFTGLYYLAARVFYLMDWFSGAFLVLFYVCCFYKRAFTPYQQITRFVFFAPVIAYFFYYSWGGNQWGPRYYYEGIPFLGLALGETLTHWWNSGNNRTRKSVLVLVLFGIFSNVYLFHKQAALHSEASAQRKSLYVLAEKTIDAPAIVFIKGFLGDKIVMAEEDAVRNSPFLDGRILYAHDLGDKNVQLMNFFPTRKYYRGTYDRKAGTPVLEDIGTMDS